MKLNGFFLLLLLLSLMLAAGCDLQYLTESAFYDTTNTITSTTEDEISIYVSKTGNDLNDGLTPSTSVLTITKGIEIADATADGTRVVVAVGIYNETVSIKNGISIYGGYNADFSARNNSDRVNLLYRTEITINNDDDLGVVRCEEQIGRSTVIDGFVITGDSTGTVSTAITHWGNSGSSLTPSPTIQNCTLTGGSATNSCGIYINHGNPSVKNCIIDGGNGAANIYGIYAEDQSAPVITYNTINGGQGNYSCGIYLRQLSDAQIAYNYSIKGGNGATKSTGINCDSTTDSAIYNNALIDGGTGFKTTAISANNGASPTITANYINGGDSTVTCIGIELFTDSRPAISYNTIDCISNGYGIYERNSESGFPLSLNGNSFLSTMALFYGDCINDVGPVYTNITSIATLNTYFFATSNITH